MGRFARLAALAALATACRRDPDAAPPCGAVAARFLLIAENDLAGAGADDADRRAVLDTLPAMRDALAGACTDSHWSAQVRRCLHAAADHTAFAACQRDLTDAQRRDLDRAARGATETDPD
jgi:hypothetical protein